MWQVCHLEVPYKKFKKAKLFQEVFQNGARPKIHKKKCNASKTLMSTISDCWSPDIDIRPEFDAIEAILAAEIESYSGGDMLNVLDFSARSENNSKLNEPMHSGRKQGYDD